MSNAQARSGAYDNLANVRIAIAQCEAAYQNCIMIERDHEWLSAARRDWRQMRRAIIVRLRQLKRKERGLVEYLASLAA